MFRFLHGVQAEAAHGYGGICPFHPFAGNSLEVEAKSPFWGVSLVWDKAIVSARVMTCLAEGPERGRR